MRKRLFTTCIALLLLAAMLLPFGASAQGLVQSAATDEPTLNVKYQNLSFRDNVVIKYAVELIGVESAQLLVWTSPKSEYVFGTQDKILETVGYQTIDEGSDTKYWVYDYTDLSAKQMTDEIYVRAYANVDGKAVYSQVKKFSILEYALTVRSLASTNADCEAMLPVLNKMLEFGAEAQKYFNYNTDRLATADYYRTTVIGGTLSDGTTSGLYIPGTKVELFAPTTNADGQPFYHWENSNGGEVSAPITTGSADATYTAVYGASTEQNFTPILRFVVASDTHLANSVSDEDARLTKMFTSAYAYSDGHEKYNGLDGVFVVGDCVDKGTQEAMNRYFSIVNENLKEGTFSFSTLGNHEYYTTKYIQELIDAGGTAIYDETVEWFKTASGYEDVDLHTTIGGYHFIFLSPDGTGWNFSDTKKAWLDAELAEAAADDPTGRKPIFVFQHEPPKDTVIGSTEKVELSQIFNKYPQVVDFSGHTHYPINDPRSIWQGGYTALNTGSMKYLSYDIAGVKLDDIANATDYEGGWGFLTDATVIPDGGAYYIVEVSADNAILIKRYDVDGEAFCMKPIFIPSVGDPDEFIYGEDREDSDDIPAFADGAKATVSSDTTSITVSFPQANAGAYVNHYRVELLRGGNVAQTRYVLSGTAQCPVPESRTVKLMGLRPDTTYTVRVTPVSSFAVDGTALTANATTAALDYDTTVTAPTPDVFELVMNTNGTATNGVTGDALTASTAGAPTVTYNSQVGQNVANFNRAENWYYEGIKNYYNVMQDSMTFELFFRADSFDNHDAPFSNFQSGGYGFEVKNGKLDFGIHLNGAYKYVYADIPEDIFVHVVAVYDGASVKLYVNGILEDEVAASGDMKLPTSTCQFLCIGADSQPSKVGDAPFDGSIAVANVYSTALSKDQICALYMDHTSNEYSLPTADIFELELNENGTATNKADGTTLDAVTHILNGSDTTIATTPVVDYDENLDALAVKLDGNSAFIYSDMSDKYDKIRTSVTMEMLVRADDFSAAHSYAFSNQQSGGIGFTLRNTDTVEISMNLGGTYYTATGNFTRGEVFHAVGTYDGATLRLYINGKLVDETAIVGSLKDPTIKFLAIGADSKSFNTNTGIKAVEYPMEGALSVANMYSYALDADTVAQLYNSYN